VQKRPTAAKVDAPELEGAWGNVQTTAVSREALVEAEADRVEEEAEPRSWGTIIKIGLAVAGILLLLGVGAAYFLKRHAKGTQDDAMKKALAFVDPKSEVKLKKEQAALIQMLAGEYDLAQDKPADAKSKFITARGGIEQPSTPERCCAYIELACRQASLAGNKPGARLDWDKDKVNGEVRSTLSRLPAGAGEEFRDMRACALRRLTRVLAAQGNVAGLQAISNSLAAAGEQGEALAVIGLELLAMGQRDEAERIAKQASASQANSESLIALLLALGGPDAGAQKQKEALEKASKVAPPPGGAAPLTPVSRAGYAEGWARQGRIDDGRKLAWTGGSPEERLRAGAAVAGVVVQTRKSDMSDLEQCAKLAETEAKGRPESKWLLFRLVQLSLQAGSRELAGRFAAAISDEGLKAWARYEIFRDGLAASPNASVDEATAVGGEDRLARWFAVVELMRHKAAAAGKGAALGEVAGWPAGPAQAFGYAGVALSEK
jgi:hypothetical protein